ncbi:MAG TPA: sigma-70 family RNA polymerase sigma factor [Isosphaeraceae bacterium]|nr:sigma-70 family RNA polymerase sigma factor [Isosphaeraceae bacterium]
MSQASRTPEELLERARAGDLESFGQLLSRYRNYARLLARTLIGTTLRLRLDPSDLVQETFLEAHRDFSRFAGSTERELLAWLRRILARNLADQARRQKAGLRDHRRQVSLEAILDRSSARMQHALAAVIASPSAAASQREQAVLLADALAGLPPDYREVIILRNIERLRFEEVAARMGRSAGAVRMLWTRALERLSKALEGLA